MTYQRLVDLDVEQVRATAWKPPHFSPITGILLLYAIILMAAVLADFNAAGAESTGGLDIGWLRHAAGSDSWAPMQAAMRWLAAAPEGHRLYGDLLLDQGIKFQYPPTSLLISAAASLIPGFDVTISRDFNRIGWFMVIVQAAATAWLLIYSLSRYAPPRFRPQGRYDQCVLALLVLLLTFTFYPIIRSYILGQVQTWMNALFGLALIAWMLDRRALAGLACGLLCLVKPQLILLGPWAALRREWVFLSAWAITCAVGGMVSLWLFGLDAHLDYLNALAFLGRHGEGFYPNQSVNGLLNRLLFNGNNLEWQEHRFPPYNPLVYFGTLCSSALLIGFALFWRRQDGKAAGGVLDFMIAVLSITMASPIAWEHHYGIALPMFAVALPLALRCPAGKHERWLAALAVIYALMATRLDMAQQFADTWLNPLQSTLLLAALVFLVILYRLRAEEANHRPHRPIPA